MFPTGVSNRGGISLQAWEVVFKGDGIFGTRGFFSQLTRFCLPGFGGMLGDLEETRCISILSR